MEDRDRQEARRFTLPDDEKERRLQDVRARLHVDGQTAPAERSGGGWLLPALFWTALIGLGTLGAVSYTHLDVYKRQPARRPSPWGGG